ncbi:hypothetical protein T12_11063 [Trichinella patagoniensis]|uniref:Uncharacterized protein n=1 Tax=Trichinella patagoniensis TaxID=990121 RepID=A0A0V1A2Z1_9BILA|nr:hypothetical protein T12_11063 [Trichinella patagoniensis]
MPTVRLMFPKNNHIKEFYAVHDLHYSLGISLMPSMLQFLCIFAQYLTELLACTRIIITVQMLVRSRTLPGGYKTITVQRFLQYLAKYAFMKRATRFRKVPRQTNAYVSNKWLLKFPCAYLNTQGIFISKKQHKPIHKGRCHTLK